MKKLKVIYSRFPGGTRYNWYTLEEDLHSVRQRCQALGFTIHEVVDAPAFLRIRDLARMAHQLWDAGSLFLLEDNTEGARNCGRALEIIKDRLDKAGFCPQTACHYGKAKLKIIDAAQGDTPWLS